MSYAMIGFPNEGASARRMLLGMTVRNAFFPKWARMSSATWRERFVLSSYMVRSTPPISSIGFRVIFTRSIVSIRSVTPSSAKYSHWIGIRTSSAAHRPFSVRSPSDGGQSTSRKS